GKLLEEKKQKENDDRIYTRDAMKFFSDLVAHLKKEARDTPQRNGSEFFETPPETKADTFKLGTSKKVAPVGQAKASFKESKRKITVTHKIDSKERREFDFDVKVVQGELKLYRDGNEIQSADLMDAFFGELATELVT